jgi:hypothetical protein
MKVRSVQNKTGFQGCLVSYLPQESDNIRWLHESQVSAGEKPVFIACLVSFLP